MRFIIILSFLILNGCATTVTVGSAPTDEMSTIVGQIDRSEGFWRWKAYGLLRVDNVPVNQGFMADPQDAKARVAPSCER